MPGPWFLYLDESGDLGFDPDKKGRSRFFTICILAVSTPARNRTLTLEVRKTIKRLLNPKGMEPLLLCDFALLPRNLGSKIKESIPRHDHFPRSKRVHAPKSG